MRVTRVCSGRRPWALGAMGARRPAGAFVRMLTGWLLGCMSLVSVARADAPPAVDRWVEIDLYWFDAQAPERSAAAYWERYEPMYRGSRGHRGVILNVGFTVNHVMAYCELDQAIALPKPSGQELGPRLEGALAGDSAARQAAWRRRFSGRHDAGPQIGYGQWSYRALQALTAALRAEGARRGIEDFRVGSFVVAFRNAYGEVAPFAQAHPEAWTRWRPAADLLDSSAYFDPSAPLNADRGCFAGLPGGIAQGTAAHEVFVAQWAALARAVGLDAIMFRDGMGFPRAYTRYGPWGLAVPDRAAAEKITGGMAALLRGIKQIAPRTLTMMYSTAATATSDWRANGLDLERIARAGDLDIFVDQTWAGAWNEVGVRRQTFWNAPILGWTYQLGTLLLHRAMLSGTRVRHYFLTETFDAWESWNTIRTARARLRWAIWAWSHVGAKTPGGLEMMAGTYVSWGNSGHDLIAAEDVAFLARTLDEAAHDAAATVDLRGPTLVYSREAFAAQFEVLSPEFDVRDRTDEQIGTIAKWGVPMLSATRAEWVPDISSDLFVFGATAGINAALREAIVDKAEAGQPMAFLGAFGSATDAALLALGGASVAAYDPPLQDRMLQARLGPRAVSVAGAGRRFSAPPPTRSNRTADADVVYRFADSVGMSRRRSKGVDVLLWDPPPITDYWYRPIRDNLNGDPRPYALAAASMADQLALRDAPRLAKIELAQTAAVSAWELRGGGLRVLVGNLEEGLRDDADHTRRITLRLPLRWQGRSWSASEGRADTRSAHRPGLQRTDLRLTLPPQGSVLLRSDPPRRSAAGDVVSRPPARQGRQ